MMFYWIILGQIILNPYNFSPPVSNTLNNGLIYYYGMEETGTRFDGEPTGTPQDLTDNNTVAQGAGKKGFAAQWQPGVVEYLSHPDSPDLSIGDIDLTWTFWVYPTSSDANYNIITQGTDISDDLCAYRIYMPTDTAVRFRLSNGSTHGDVTTPSGSVPINTFTYVRVEHDAAANTISIELNNSGTVTTTSYSGGGFDSTAQFCIGYLQGSSGFSGLIDEVKFWKRKLTTQEQADDYGGGTPPFCCPIP